MVELLATILRNVICHPGLGRAVAAQPGLPLALVGSALCGCQDSLAVSATCRFLDEACISEVRRSTEPLNGTMHFPGGDLIPI